MEGWRTLFSNVNFYEHPNVYHTHDVALVWIYNSECRSEMRCTRLKIQDAKKSLFWHLRTTLSGCIFAGKAYIENQKKMLNIDTSSTCPRNMVNFGLLTAEICWWVWEPPRWSTFLVVYSGLCSRCLWSRRRSASATSGFIEAKELSTSRTNRWCCSQTSPTGWTYTIRFSCFWRECSYWRWRNITSCRAETRMGSKEPQHGSLEDAAEPHPKL